MYGLKSINKRDCIFNFNNFSKCIIGNDTNLLLITFFSCVCVYGFELFNFTFSIDEELCAIHGTNMAFIPSGRWATALLHIVFTDKIIPFFKPLLALIFLTLAAIAAQDLFRFKSLYRYIFCITFVSFPQFAYQLEFMVQSECISLGLLIGIISIKLFILFLYKNNFLYFVCSVCLFSFATSIYQSLYFFIFTTGYAVIFWTPHKVLFKRKGSKRTIVNFIVLCFIAFLLYIFLSKISNIIFQFKTSNISYLIMNVGWLKNSWTECIKNITISIWKHITGVTYFGEKIYLTLIVPYIVFGLNIIKQKSTKYFIQKTCHLFAIIISPFLQIIIFGQAQAPRTFLTQSIVFALLWSLTFKQVKIGKYSTIIILATLILFSSSQVSQLFFLDYMNFESDKLLANRIIERIYYIDNKFSQKTTKVYIHGHYSHPISNKMKITNTDTFGTSFFEHDGGNIYRTQAFFLATGIAAFIRPSKKEILDILDIINEHPIWPHKGSVFIVGDIVVVKLSKEAGYIEQAEDYIANPF